MTRSLTFLTPLAGLLAALALVPLTALAVAVRRVRRTRTLLRLPGGRDLGLNVGFFRFREGTEGRGIEAYDLEAWISGAEAEL